MAPEPLNPGMGLKFLRDGIDSSNLVAMHDLSGTPGNWNFFSQDLKNHIGPITGTILSIAASKFATATDYI
jgi:hypothetical protein